MKKKSSPINTEAVEVLKAELFGDCLSAEEVALVLGVDRMTVLRYLRDGKIAAFQMGRRYYIPRKEVVAFVKRLKMGTPPPIEEEAPTHNG